jgi:hypothetical protein
VRKTGFISTGLALSDSEIFFNHFWFLHIRKRLQARPEGPMFHRAETFGLDARHGATVFRNASANRKLGVELVFLSVARLHDNAGLFAAGSHIF